MNKFSSLASMAVLLFLNGCAPTQIKTYEGPTRPSQELALVTCDHAVVIVAVDGNKAHSVSAGGGMWHRGCEISVTPGLHTFEVADDFNSLNKVAIIYRGIPVAFDAQAGRTYRVKLGNSWDKSKHRIEDVTENARGTIKDGQQQTTDRK